MLKIKLVHYLLLPALLFCSYIKAAIQLPADSLPVAADSNISFIILDSNSFFRTGTTLLPEELSLPAYPANKLRETYVQEYLLLNSYELEKIRTRSAQYFTVMDSIFTRLQLPVELKYLAVVESGLKNKAVSSVGARGIWQLMPVTARTFKLKVTAAYDERTHLYKSTLAAATYLKSLHARFGDWLLAIAAYNSGPGPVLKAIRLSGSRNFWKLQHLLPAETRAHVKKFISTHYFFEGDGGITTLTKAEALLYLNQVQIAIVRYNKKIEDLAISESKENKPLPGGMLAKASGELLLNNEQQGLKPLTEKQTLLNPAVR